MTPPASGAPRDLAERIASLPPEQRRRLEERLAAEAPQPCGIEPTDATEGPLASPQRRLWLLDRLRPGSAAHHVVRTFRIRGPLDRSRLAGAVDTVAARHEALRTQVTTVDSHPRQRIVTPPTGLLDVRDVGAADVDAAMTSAVRRPFDLDDDLPFRARLLSVDSTDHRLVLVFHHIAVDGRSVPLLLDDLSRSYGGDPLPPPSGPRYLDYALWEERRWSPDALKLHVEHWRRLLGDAPPASCPPSDRIRPATRQRRAEHHRFTLPRDVASAVHATARREAATPFAVVMAAVAAGLQRLTLTTDLLVGMPCDLRSDPALDRTVGMFVNTLPLRLEASGPVGFGELVRRTYTAIGEALDHRQVPFETIVAQAGAETSGRTGDLVRTVVTWQERARTSLDLAGCRVEDVPSHPPHAKFDLTLSFLPEPGDRVTLHGEIQYACDLYDRATIERFAQILTRVLEQGTTQPARAVAGLPLATDEEQQRLRVALDRTGNGAPRETCGVLFREQASTHPERVAVRDGARRLSYADLERRSDALAAVLQERAEARAGQAVALLLPRSAELVVAMVAVAKLGAVYVPVDPADPSARVERLLRRLRPAAIVTSVPVPPDIADTIPFEQDTVQEDEIRRAFRPRQGPAGTAEPREIASPDEVERAEADAPAYVMYTSGSTGDPKAVVVPHRGIVNLVRGEPSLALEADDIVAHASNPAFDAATFEVWGALLNGASLVVVPADDLLSPARLGPLLAHHQVTTMFVTTALLNTIAATRPATFAPLRHLIFGGEQVDPGAVRRILAHGPPDRVTHAYGPTETTTFATLWEVATVPDDAATIPIGRPVAGTRARVVDAAGGPVPAAVPGELHIGGAGVALGYLDDPRSTGRRFTADPAEDGRRWYRTGDLARTSDAGVLTFVGRTDDQLKIRGFRIEPGEVRAALDRIPGVGWCHVDAWDGGGDRILAAWVVGNGGLPPPSDIRAELRQTLPGHLVPDLIRVVDKLPLTPNGKLDRRRLPDPTAGLPADETPAADELTGAIAGVFSSVLGRRDVGPDDDFFEIGGHSLLAVHLVEALERRFDRTLPLAGVFESSTPRRIAAVLREDPASTARRALVRLQPGAGHRPVFLVHGGGGFVLAYRRLATAMAPDIPIYALQATQVEQFVHHRTVETMARHYLAEIRRVQPSGPYHLAGHSLGGVVAFEMGQQLHRRGENVATLTLIDTSAPTAAKWRSSPRERRDIHLDKLRDRGMLGAIAYALDRTGRRFRGLMHEAVCRGAAMLHLRPPSRSLHSAIRTSLLRSIADYEPQHFDGRLTLLQAEEHLPGWDTPAGWERNCDELEVVPVPGAHNELLRSPYVEVLGERLTELVRRGDPR